MDERQPGDALSPGYVREIRKSAGLTQDEFARRLGLQGGKSTVSGWETARAACEGPAAELILLLFGQKPGDVLVQGLLELARSIWERESSSIEQWRQVVCYSDGEPIPIEPFFSLFPDASIPTKDSVHGFPFYEVNGMNVIGFERDMWRGVLPEKGGSPSYLWLLDREKQFLYRERWWEVDPMSLTGGHLQLGEMIVLAQRTTHFLKQLYELIKTNEDEKVILRLEVGGMNGRGIGYYRSSSYTPHVIDFLPPTKVWSQDKIGAQTTVTVKELKLSPMQVAQNLVAIFVSKWDPRMAQLEFLEKILQTQLHIEGNSIPRLAFLKHLIKG